jgi:hypothetical protein
MRRATPTPTTSHTHREDNTWNTPDGDSGPHIKSDTRSPLHPSSLICAPQRIPMSWIMEHSVSALRHECSAPTLQCLHLDCGDDERHEL